MGGNLKDFITRRRALWITPFAFAGLVALTSRKGSDSEESSSGAGSGEEVTIIAFDDSGRNLGPKQMSKIKRSKAEWRKLLSREQYYVMREQGTDTSYTGTYFKLHEPGLFRCAGCGNALFLSDAKFDSGTGWPSFWAPAAEENIRRHSDVSMLMERTEVMCRRCDSHLGHVFNDGPAPTGLRYCIDESALRFIPRPEGA